MSGRRGALVNVLWRSSVGAGAVDPALLPPGWDVRVVVDAAAAATLRDWADILVDGRPSGELLDGARLQRVVVPYAGVAPEVRERLAERPHLALHNSHFNAPFVAQHAVALLLAVAGRIVEGHVPLTRGDWRPRYDDGFTSIDLTGRRCLLVGHGAIGREVGTRVRGLGMSASAVRRSRVEDADVPTYPPDRLAEAMADADVAVVSLPLTPETRGTIGDRELAALGSEGILVNVGRGEVVDEDALYRAVRDRTIFGAGLDVWWRYPDSETDRAATFPSRVPLHTLPTVVMSPHRANQVRDWEAASFADVAQTLREAAAGRERNRVDLARGY